MLIQVPHSKESEMMVLGCMLNCPHAFSIAAESLDTSDFYFEEHKIIFQVLKAAHEEDRPVDVHIMSEVLKQQDKLKKIGGVGTVTSLAQFAGTSVYTEEYIKIVKNKSVLRRLYTKAQDFQRKSSEQDADSHCLLEEFKKDIKSIESNHCCDDSYFTYLLENNSEKRLIEEMKNISPGLNTGFTIGDTPLKLPGGALSVIALPTGHGKTTILINCSLGVLRHHHDKSVYFFTYEESGAAILTYFLNTWFGRELSKNNREFIKDYFRVNSTEYFKSDVRAEFICNKKAFFENLIDNGRLRIFYTDMRIEELITSIRFIKKHANVGLICIDYIQCLKLLNPFQGSRQEQLKEISYMLKDVAVETGLPIFLGAQFNREVLCEGDISPTRIREAADIEHIANLLIGGWNRNYNGFNREGNKGKDNKQIPVEAAIYLEIMKGRGIGNGHNSVMDFNGNTGALTNRIMQSTANHKQNSPRLPEHDY